MDRAEKRFEFVLWNHRAIQHSPQKKVPNHNDMRYAPSSVVSKFFIISSVYAGGSISFVRSYFLLQKHRH